MLQELNISNFAIIDRLNLRLNPGFNALTGETGAGKSIIIDAMGAMLGEKIGAEFVRHGTDRARVEGFFEVKINFEDDRFRHLLDILDENELIDPEDRPTPENPILRLTLGREITSSGRTVCRINGSAVKTDMLRDIGQALVDIHGQTEHISLLRVGEHLELLDQYANLSGQRRRLAEMVGQLRAIRKEKHTLQRDERELVRRTELLKFQVSEIEAAALQPGEEEELQKERQLQNATEKLTGVADRAYRVLYQGYDEDSGDSYSGGMAGGRGRATGGGGRMSGGGSGRSVQASLTEVEGLLADLANYEPSFKQYNETVLNARYQLEDVAQAVRDFRDRVEFDPARLEEVEERLDLIRALKRKYGSSIEEILEFYKTSADELNSIEHSGERVQELTQQESKLLVKIGHLAAEISAERQKAGKQLAGEVEQSLRDLRLLKARFEVHITQSDDPHGAPIKNGDGEVRRLAFDAKGFDRVEFLVSLNPGEPPKPLQKVASGGETSRLMLALKSILAAADAIPTLIFDEVDVGVGGRSGQVVGEKLWQLTNLGEHQVICITHLPQIAAFGDGHYNIVKRVEGERTSTSVRRLSDPERIDELAAMLGGTPVTEINRLSAQEMLQEISTWKKNAHDTRANGKTLPEPETTPV